MSPISFFKRERNLSVVFTFSISANACCKRQSDTQNGKECSAKKNNKRALAPASPILLCTRLISVMELLIFKASATASARATTRCSPPASRRRKTAAASASAAPKPPRRSSGGRLFRFSRSARSSSRRHGAGAEEARSVVGDFLEKDIFLVIFGDVFVVSEWKMKPIWIEICIELYKYIINVIVNTKMTISWWNSSQVKPIIIAQCEISKHLNLDCCHWHTYMLVSIPVINSWLPVLNPCISWEHICKVFRLLLLFFSLCGLKHTKKTQVELC